MKRTTATVLLAAAFGTGCARFPTAEDRATVWLAEAPRALAVRVNAEFPEPRLVTRDYQVDKRVSSGLVTGAGGALYVVANSCTAGLGGCVVGLVLAPVGFAFGATVGAASVDPVDEYHPIDAAEGGARLLDLPARGIDLPSLVRDAALSEGTVGGHKLQAEGGEAELRIGLTRLDLLGSTGKDPRVGIVLVAYTELVTPEAHVRYWRDFRYEGPKRHVSEWEANEGRLLVEEISTIARLTGAELVRHIAQGPTVSALVAVARARRKATTPPFAAPSPSEAAAEPEPAATRR